MFETSKGKKIEEAPQDVRRVVLAFSGQSKQAFNIDEGLYKSCYIFRTYLDRCNQLMIDLGISEDLYPAIFQDGPFADVKIPYCSMFLCSTRTHKRRSAVGSQSTLLWAIALAN